MKVKRCGDFFFKYSLISNNFDSPCITIILVGDDCMQSSLMRSLLLFLYFPHCLFWFYFFNGAFLYNLTTNQQVMSYKLMLFIEKDNVKEYEI